MEIAELAKVLSMEDPSEGTVGDLAERYQVVLAALERLAVIKGTLEDDLAARMEQDLVWTGAGWLSRTAEKRSRWRDEDASSRFRDDIAQAVVRTVSVDVATGELDPFKRNVARAAIDLLWQIVPAFSDVKMTGKRLGIHTDEYRESDVKYKVGFSKDSI